MYLTDDNITSHTYLCVSKYEIGNYWNYFIPKNKTVTSSFKKIIKLLKIL